MKKKLILLGLCVFMCGTNKVDAKNNLTLNDIENGFNSKIEEVNENSSCYISTLERTSENEVTIYYTLKGESSETYGCVDPKGWNFKIKDDSHIALYNSFYLLNRDNFLNVDVSELLSQDIVWFNIFAEIMNYGFTFSDLSGDSVSDADGLMLEKDFYYVKFAYHFSLNGAALATNYIAGFGFLLNHDVLEVDGTTSNSIKLKYNQYATSIVENITQIFQLSLDGKEYHDIEENNITHTNGYGIELLNLKPNTKYYIKLNSEIYGTKIVEATTLPMSEASSGDSLEESPKGEIENPETGIMVPVGMVLFGIILVIIIKRKRSNIYKI